MFQKVKNSLNKKANELYSYLNPTPTQQLKYAITHNDETKAMEVYSSLIATLKPSQLFESEINDSMKHNYSETTPFHLACQYSMKSLITLFLQNGGDPCRLNISNETALHSLCQRSDHQNERSQLVLEFLNYVSIHTVDTNGFTCLHHAAKNGLLKCKLKYIILSIIH